MAEKAVLVIEDAVFVREIEKRYLRNNGFNLIGETNSEQEGVELFRAHDPDLVILDLHLAEGTGINAIRRILEIKPDARLVVVTSYDEEIKEENPELVSRIAAILTKPFTEEEFMQAIQKLS